MKEHWKKIVIGGSISILFVVGIIFQNNQVEEPSSTIFQPVIEDEEPVVEYIYVDIKGAVEQPGVYKLFKNSRLFQAIDLAGGLRSDADGDALNLSIVLMDQDVIYVPDITEEYPVVTSSHDPTSTSGLIDINRATIDQLETLPGIGPSTAQKIIDYRTQNGFFEAIEDIMNVSGIGESTFDNIKDLITI